MNPFKQIGTVEVLRLRVTPLDPASPGHTQVVVDPGEYPLFSDGFSRLWIMDARINGNTMRRGDGLFAITQAGDNPIDIWVRTMSRVFGPDEWEDLLAAPLATEGHPDQRLRVNERPTDGA